MRSFAADTYGISADSFLDALLLERLGCINGLAQRNGDCKLHVATRQGVGLMYLDTVLRTLSESCAGLPHAAWLDPLLPDDLCATIALLLPPEPSKPKGGRPRLPDRAALTGILFVLRSGLP